MSTAHNITISLNGHNEYYCHCNICFINIHRKQPSQSLINSEKHNRTRNNISDSAKSSARTWVSQVAGDYCLHSNDSFVIICGGNWIEQLPNDCVISTKVGIWFGFDFNTDVNLRERLIDKIWLSTQQSNRIALICHLREHVYCENAYWSPQLWPDDVVIYQHNFYQQQRFKRTTKLSHRRWWWLCAVVCGRRLQL